MNKSITQPITQACLFSSHAYFQVSQFLEALIFEPRLFSRKYGSWTVVLSFKLSNLFSFINQLKLLGKLCWVKA